MVRYCSFFPKNINRFIKWIGYQKNIFVSWGDIDNQVLVDNCKYHKIDSTWLSRYINLQEVFMNVNSLKQPISLSNALKMYNINTPHEHHRALKDAFNTTVLLTQLSDQCRIKDYITDVKLTRKPVLINNKKKDFNEFGKKAFERLLLLELIYQRKNGRIMTWDRLLKGKRFAVFSERYDVTTDVLNIMMNNFPTYRSELTKKNRYNK